MATIKEISANVGNVVTVTKVNGDTKHGVLVGYDAANKMLKVKKPGGGPGRPALVALADVSTFVVNGKEPVLTSAPAKAPKAAAKPKKPLITKKVTWQEAAGAVITEAQAQVADEVEDEIDDEATGPAKLALPARKRRCPYSGAVVTRENGFRVSFAEMEDGELVDKDFFFDKNVPEIAALIAALRTDRETEEEIDDEIED